METDLSVVLFLVATGIFYVLVLMSGHAGSGKDFYTSQTGVLPLARGMGLAADWLCAATLVGWFGLLSINPVEAQWVLTGWMIGLVLLSLVVAPVVYHSGHLSLSHFIADQFDSISVQWLLNAVIFVIGVALLALQLRGLGLILSRHLQMSISASIIIGMVLIFFYTVLSNLRAITRVQMLKYCIIFCAVILSSIYVSIGNDGSSQWIFLQNIFITKYDSPFEMSWSTVVAIEVVFSVVVLALGIAIFPHMLKRFQGVKRSADLRFSAIWMLLFLGVIYSSLPWMSGQFNEKFAHTIDGPLQEGGAYSRMPNWLFLWEYTHEVSWVDSNNDGRIQWLTPSTRVSEAKTHVVVEMPDNFVLLQSIDQININRQQSVSRNEFWITDEVKFLLLPELFEMPHWIAALITVGLGAAMLSTASMLLNSTIFTLVFKADKGLFLVKHEALFTKGLAMIMLTIAAIIAIYLTGNLVDWFNRVVQLAAAGLFPVFVFAVTATRLPGFAISVGMIAGLVTSLSYTVVYETNNLSSFWPSALPMLPPLPMTVFWMLLNAMTALTLAWLFNLRAVTGDTQSDDTC